MKSKIVLLILAVLISCSKAAEETESKVKIGVLVPLTGDFAYFGEVAKEAIIKAPNSQKISFVFEDSACDAKKALSSYRKLSDVDGVRLFLGPCCGNELESIAPLLEKENKLMLSLCSSTGELFERSKGRLLSPVFSIEEESRFMAEHMDAGGYKKIAIVYFNNAFSVAHETAFRSALSESKALTYKFDKYDPEAVRDITLRFRKDTPDAIYAPDLSPFLLSFATQLHKTGLGNIPIFSIHATQTSTIFSAEGKSADGIVYSHPDIGEESADVYYPAIAAKIISEAIAVCSDKVECVKDYLLEHNTFSKDGTMKGTLVLKTIQDGKFVPFVSKP